ncbi:hypothetical protein Pse7367_2805 [Thalassoporum mexicanum PCC 7367]|uniref:D-alanyl-lipoteichoic acid biosynthesis protein DltD n=1 Tax=Thalassoporum mexicanum TaxID=3457544 RepID=UPI00029FFC4A|nr:D-alanyl-lipoteichoic acid biosynthesis protein DltD [Pseudanabaena sp. PCC 7367]AFY71058.1 hypothetical protein Pse7367_2805 [Pseudanabaena sp. PCC 7367]
MELSQSHRQNLALSDRPSESGWHLDNLAITKARQQGDCLYLHIKTNAPHQVISAIASNAAIHAEGINRMKLHGKKWALGLDMPLGDAAFVAAGITERLVKLPQLAQATLKVLLKYNCLSVLCESKQELVKAVTALPVLEVLRQSHPSEYFQSVTVSSRVAGAKSVSWRFDVDLAVIGVEPDSAQTNGKGLLNGANGANGTSRNGHAADSLGANLVPFDALESGNGNHAVDLEQIEQVDRWQILKKSGTNTLSYLQQWSREFFKFRWLVTTADSAPSPADRLNGHPPRRNQLKNNDLGLITCTTSLIVGLATTLVIDRSLVGFVNDLPEPTTAVLPAPPANLDQAIVAEQEPLPNYNNEHLNQKLELLRWHVAANRQPPEVMIFGSSRAFRGIDPVTLERSLQEYDPVYKHVEVFNMGINGATAQVVNLQLTRIMSPEQLPRMIILADGVRAFNSSRPDLTYQDIASSEGYLELLISGGDRPDLAGDNLDEAKQTLKHSPYLRDTANAILQAYDQRGQLREALVEGYNHLAPGLSNTNRLVDQSAPSQLGEMDDRGFIGVNVVFDPRTYFQAYTRVSGKYDSDYRDLDLYGEQIDAFYALTNFCRRHNIELVVINMPLHSTYLDEARSQYEQEFNDRMNELADRWDFAYIDLSTQWQDQPQLFSDPSHLNINGAVALSRQLVGLSKINWQILQY